MHDEHTISVFHSVTRSLGKELRRFKKDVCLHYHTLETPQEAQSRRQRDSRKPLLPVDAREPSSSNNPNAVPLLSSNHSNDSTSDAAALITETIIGRDKGKGKLQEVGGRRVKTFNLNTYKVHSLGDYATAILGHGTSDNFSGDRVSSLFLLLPHPLF